MNTFSADLMYIYKCIYDLNLKNIFNNKQSRFNTQQQWQHSRTNKTLAVKCI